VKYDGEIKINRDNPTELGGNPASVPLGPPRIAIEVIRD
jgi:hypothetical protein